MSFISNTILQSETDPASISTAARGRLTLLLLEGALATLEITSDKFMAQSYLRSLLNQNNYVTIDANSTRAASTVYYQFLARIEAILIDPRFASRLKNTLDTAYYTHLLDIRARRYELTQNLVDAANFCQSYLDFTGPTPFLDIYRELYLKAGLAVICRDKDAIDATMTILVFRGLSRTLGGSVDKIAELIHELAIVDLDVWLVFLEAIITERKLPQAIMQVLCLDNRGDSIDEEHHAIVRAGQYLSLDPVVESLLDIYGEESEDELGTEYSLFRSEP